jgi:hypothetical protein
MLKTKPILRESAQKTGLTAAVETATATAVAYNHRRNLFMETSFGLGFGCSPDVLLIIEFGLAQCNPPKYDEKFYAKYSASNGSQEKPGTRQKSFAG